MIAAFGSWASTPLMYAGDSGRQGPLMLKEVQVAPGPALGVVHRAAGAPADRTREPAPLGKAHGQVETTGLHVEPDPPSHGPGGLQPQGQIEQLVLRHAVSSSPWLYSGKG